MTDYQTLVDTIAYGKTVAIDWVATNITNSNNGEQDHCLDIKLVMLVEWIDVLTKYQLYNYDDDGNPLDEPLVECLTEDQLALLISKVNALECELQ